MTPEERYAKRRRYEKYERQREARSARNRRYYLAHRDEIIAAERRRRGRA